MGRHKGELSKSAIDSGWPHQVFLPEHCYARQNYPVIHQFCQGLSLCDLGHTFYRDRTWFRAFCFAEREHADRFMVRFGGEMIDPRERPRRRLRLVNLA